MIYDITGGFSAEKDSLWVVSRLSDCQRWLLLARQGSLGIRARALELVEAA